MSQNSCFACSPQVIERRLLLASLRKQLIRFNHEYQPDFRQENDTQILNDLAFSRLIEIIFNDDSTLHKPTNKCSHHRFVRYLRRKLKCNSKTFNDLCNQLILTLAERNYQLNLLSMQIKSAQITAQNLLMDTTLSKLIDLQVKRREDDIEFDTKQSLNVKAYTRNREQNEYGELMAANEANNRSQASLLRTYKQQSN